MNKSFLAPLLLLAALATSAPAEDPPLKVFILAGTSNMLGANAKPENLPEDLKGPQKDILVYRGGEWTPLEAGKNLVGNEATFGQAMTKHLGEPIGIVWISVRYVASPSIGPNINNIVKQSQAKGRPIEIAGLLLDVSFGDGLKEETAKTYGENLQKWIEATRRDLGNDKLPTVMMRAIPPLPSTPFLEIVRKAQDDLKLPSLHVIPCDDVPRGGDKVHFNTTGRLEMGKRYAAGMIELLKAEKVYE
jgi:hypothetical protein